MNAFGDEPLSLGTFEAAHAAPPYLNTPRSLEACRRHGINPVELVEVSVDEFRKDFPDDPDGAQRRYDRIDGARRRMLTTVLTEWKHLCDTNWSGAARRPGSSLSAAARPKERILDVPDEAHSTMLETQAARFRKIEMDQWNALQRMLAMSVKNADANCKSKTILQKQEAIGESNETARKEMQLKREALFKENMETKKRKEYEAMQEVKKLQVMDAEEAAKKKERDQERKVKEKEVREKRERDRLQREEYTKQLKKSIMKSLEDKADARKRLADLQTKESLDRVREAREQREAEQAVRKKELADKQLKARSDVVLSAEEQRQAMVDKIAADEEKRQRIKDQRNLERGSTGAKNDVLLREKMKKIREATAETDREKSSKALADLQFKEALAKQELDKVKDAQLKRRSIKAIRQEAYDLAATRKKKADEYHRRMAEQAIKIKNDKCDAIKNGFLTLSQMRMKMRDIMSSATMQLKDEMHRLQHRDEFSPDKVIAGALEISERALFPKLKSAFGMANHVSEDQMRHIEATIGYDDGAEKTRAITAPHLTSQSTNNLRDVKTAQGRDKRDHAHGSAGGGGMTRGELPKTLPIQVLNAGHLQEALIHTKAKIDAAETQVRPTPASTPNRSPKGRGEADGYDDDFHDDDGVEGGGGQQQQRYTHSKTGKKEKSGKGPRHNPLDDEDDQVFRNFPYEGEGGGAGSQRLAKQQQQQQQAHQSDKSMFLPTKEGEFRREHSGDHPLAPGGKGQYKKEVSSGNRPAGTGGGRFSTPGSALTPTQASAQIEKLSLAAQTKVVDPQKQLEQLRREQNEALMRVLEEEKAAEDARERMSRSIFSEVEASRLELVFTEERRRASERIVRLTREHEERVKTAVLSLMSLSRGSKGVRSVEPLLRTA